MLPPITANISSYPPPRPFTMRPICIYANTRPFEMTGEGMENLPLPFPRSSARRLLLPDDSAKKTRQENSRGIPSPISNGPSILFGEAEKMMRLDSFLASHSLRSQLLFWGESLLLSYVDAHSHTHTHTRNLPYQRR